MDAEDRPVIVNLRAKERILHLADGRTFSVRRVLLSGRVAVEIAGLEIIGFGEEHALGHDLLTNCAQSIQLPGDGHEDRV